MEKKGKKHEPPVSLYPLNPEEALRAFLQVDPERVREREKRSDAGRDKPQKKHPPKKG